MDGGRSGNEQRDGLEPQFTLGEDSGLRGYDVRFFTGDRRLRINLEDRIFPEIDILSVRLGAVVFFDAGLAWYHDDSISSSDFFRSVGFGLRIGSPELVRKSVSGSGLMSGWEANQRCASSRVSASPVTETQWRSGSGRGSWSR